MWFTAPVDVFTALSRRAAAEGGRPVVTWYGPGAERVELSAKGLHNWVAKTANAMVDEFGLIGDDLLGLALPTHWRTVVWVLAAASTGVQVTFAPGPCEVLVLAAPGQADAPPPAPGPGWSPGLVAVQALPALALRAPVAPGQVDAGELVRTQSDFFSPSGGLEIPADAALAGARLLLDGAAEATYRTWLDLVVSGGSMVLCDPSAPVDDTLPERERVTGRR